MAAVRWCRCNRDYLGRICEARGKVLFNEELGGSHDEAIIR